MAYTVNNNRVIYDYDLFSRLSKKKISNFITTYEYLDLEDNKTTTLLDKITNNGQVIRYVYDELGNIEEIYKNEVLENVYEYDGLNQLILEKTYSLNQKVEYTYDLGGNILTKVYKNLSTNAIINTYSYSYDTVWKDQLISYNGDSITYDEIGNPLTYGSDITYSWINGRELSSYIDTSNELEVEYTYNDSGIRTSKVINGVEHKYYLEGYSIIYETIGEDTLYYFYDSNGSIEGFKYNEELYYYIKNGQNDIIGIIDIEGNQLVSYEYDSWGQILSIKDNQGNEITDQTDIGNINPFRYRSYYYDSETGLYYLNSRYYNPEWGRFLNLDIGIDNDHILGTNLYQYAYNNPINFVDNEGTWPKWLNWSNITKVAIGVAVIATLAVVTVATGGVGTVGFIAAGALQGAVVGAAIGTATGAVVGVISNRMSTGSWKESGDAAVNGAVNGFVTGAVSGAVTGGITRAQALNSWSKGTFDTNYQSMEYHYNNHVIDEGGTAKNMVQYTKDAKSFYNNNIGNFTYRVPTNPMHQPNLFLRTSSGGGMFTEGGKIITFWYK